MSEQVYEPCQPLPPTQRQDFYDWCATQYGYTESCRYCGYAQCSDPYHHANREAAWGVYAALRDGLNGWRDIPLPTIALLDGFYGHDHE